MGKIPFTHGHESDTIHPLGIMGKAVMFINMTPVQSYSCQSQPGGHVNFHAGHIIAPHVCICIKLKLDLKVGVVAAVQVEGS